LTFKIVGWLIPSGSTKTFKILYDFKDLCELIERIQKKDRQYVFLGLVQRKAIHDSIHSFPMFNVEIDQFVNAYSLERKTPDEIFRMMPIVDPEKLENGDEPQP
jgi:hypothetical protein